MTEYCASYHEAQIPNPCQLSRKSSVATATQSPVAPVAAGILLVMTSIAAGGCPIIENPGSSLLALHDRFQWMIDKLRSIGVSVSAAEPGEGQFGYGLVPGL